MLERNDDICIIKIAEISTKKVFNYFFESENKIIYVVDENDVFVGVITSGAFLDSLKNGEDIFVNRNCSAIIGVDEAEALKKADILFDEKHITTAIPVLDDRRKISYEIRENKKNHSKKILEDFHDKIQKYEKSNYVWQELMILRRVLQDQDIVVIGTERQFGATCERLFGSRERITVIEKLDNAYDFFSMNDKLLIDVSLSKYTVRNDIYKRLNLGYGWEEFLYTVMYIIECEYGSRYYRIIEEESDIAREHIEKYWGRNISVPSKGIFVDKIRKYLEKSDFTPLDPLCGGEVCREEYFQIDYQANGMVCKHKLSKDLMLLDCIDHILQFYDLNLQLADYGIPVLNFVFDEDAYIMEEENDRLQNVEFGFHEYVMGIKEERYINNTIYSKSMDSEYITQLEQSASFYPVKRFENDLIVFRDYKSRLVNIENGIRKTCYQPEEYMGTVYFFGPCTIYGHFVEDSYTIPSLIQKYICVLDKKYRVINLGNQIQQNAIRILDVLDIKETDIFIFLFPSMVKTIEKRIPIIEIGKEFNQLRMDKYPGKECFLDAIYHCGDNGNVIYAEIIFRRLKRYLKNEEEEKSYKNNLYNVFKKKETDLDVFYDWSGYVDELKKMVLVQKSRIGCIVMNCNPFTQGHRYLIEYALTKVDYLYVFVVEEDRSFFSFEDRYEMVKQGTDDLKNVKVVRSGRLIISSSTFPAYFKKDEIKTLDSISANEDLRVFAQYIAPILNIRYRFVGEEPQDYVTSCYNEAMKKILSQFDITVIEIPRKLVDNKIISASCVRKYYCAGDFRKIKDMVPKTSLHYLVNLFKENIFQSF